MPKSKLVDFFENPSNYLTKKNKSVLAKDGKDGSAVICSYFLTWSKAYVILIVWLRYLFDVYISYIRQFSFMNRVNAVPDDLKTVYSQAAFEEAKIHSMFRILMTLEAEYNMTVHLTVVYLTNVYCTLWWLATKLTNNLFTRAVAYNVMTSICRYKSGDMIYHANLILSSYNFTEGACRICSWIKDILKKGLNYVSTMMFVEEVILSIILTLMTTHMCLFLFMFFRLYKTFLLPIVIEEGTGNYAVLEDGELLAMLNKLNQKFDFRVQAVYVSQMMKDANAVKVRGFPDKKYIVLGCKLVEGYSLTPQSAGTLYTKAEIAAAVLRAQLEYTGSSSSYDLAIEVTRWATILIFALFLTLGLCGGSRLGFVPSPPQVISFTMSKHLSIPILLVVQIIKNYISQNKHITLDNRVIEVGFGEHLMSYVSKEARISLRCPVEDPIYTMAYSTHPPVIHRLRNLRRKLETLH